MTMGSDGSIRVPLHIDVSAVADDLAQIDKEVQRLEQRMVAAFNRGGLVRRGRAQRATSIEDIGSQRAAWTPEVRALERQLNSRLQQIERAARRGETRSPLTPAQQARHEAQQRLTAAARPTEITAKQKFFDDMVTSLKRGLGNAPAMAAAQTGIPGASGLARLLMGLAGENPLIAGGLGAAVAVGAGAIAIDAERARFQRTQASLASAMVGGPAFGDTRTMMGLGVMAAAQQMSTSKEEGGAIAYQLASAGMRPGQTVGNMQSVLGMTKGYGLQTKDVEPLVAALGTAGGMSANQIKTTLSDIVDASGKATGSIQQLTQGLGALSAVNAQAGRDVFGLAAVQRAVGPTSGINAGALMAGPMGATGTNALQIAGMLGMTPDELRAAQTQPGGMARIFDRYAALARTTGTDATGTFVAEALLGAAGMNLPPGATQQANVVARLRAAPQGQALRYAQQLQATPRPRRPSAAALARNQTSAWDNFWLGFGNLFTAGINQPTTPVLRDVQAQGLSAAGGGVGPIGGGGQYGLHTLSPSLLGQVRSAAAGDVSHNVKIDVTVKDQRGRELGHAVDHTRVVAGARTALRPPHERTGALDTPSAQQLPPRWNEGSWS